MRYIQSNWYHFKHIMTTDDKLLVLFALSLFLPFVLTIIGVVALGIYVLIKSDFKSNLLNVKGGRILCLFAIYLMIVSFVFANYLGFFVSVGMLFLFINILYYRKYIHYDLFIFIVEVMIFMSILSVIYACFEQVYYMQTVKGMSGFFDIQNKPQYRVHAFYFNANYYAMMIVFVEALLIYRFMINKVLKYRLYYIAVGCLNLFALYLSGGRIGWFALAVSILVMLVVNRWYKTLIAGISMLSVTLFAISQKPGLIPRLASKGLSLERREYIYQTARLMIRDTWFFGRGPLSYYHNYNNYYDEYVLRYGSKHLPKLGISAPHAHSILYEPLISFGLVGSLMLLYYFGLQIRSSFRLITRKVDTALAALIFGCLTITLCFSIVDFTIYWVQTAAFLFMILGTSSIYRKDVEA